VASMDERKIRPEEFDGRRSEDDLSISLDEPFC
jgi:hypothetical protein